MGNMFNDTKFLVRLAYLVYILRRRSTLNKSMKGPQIHAFTQKDIITEFMKKLELWMRTLKNNKLKHVSHFQN